MSTLHSCFVCLAYLTPWSICMLNYTPIYLQCQNKEGLMNLHGGKGCFHDPWSRETLVGMRNATLSMPWGLFYVTEEITGIRESGHEIRQLLTVVLMTLGLQVCHIVKQGLAICFLQRCKQMDVDLHNRTVDTSAVSCCKGSQTSWDISQWRWW